MRTLHFYEKACVRLLGQKLFIFSFSILYYLLFTILFCYYLYSFSPNSGRINKAIFTISTIDIFIKGGEIVYKDSIPAKPKGMILMDMNKKYWQLSVDIFENITTQKFITYSTNNPKS